MFKKILFVCGIFVFAFTILSVSVLQSSSISYSFTPTPIPDPSLPDPIVPRIDYRLPYPGGILPDNLLWSIKALRDRVWYTVTSSPLRKAELALLFSDKRLAASEILLKEGKSNIAISTLTKGEKYLELASFQESLARSRGFDTSVFLGKLAAASLKHRQMIEGLLTMVPEEGKPLIVKTEDYAKSSYKSARDGLNSTGCTPPISPFDGD